MAKSYLTRADLTMLLVTLHDEATEIWLKNGHEDTPRSTEMMRVYEHYTARFNITQDDVDAYNARMNMLENGEQ